MLKSILKSIFVFICAAILVAAQTFFPTIGLKSDASALAPGDIVMQINPSEQEIDLLPGTVTTNTLKIQNIGRLGFSVNMLVKPYQVTNEAYDPDFYTENSYTLLKNWITFSENEFYLEAGAEKKLPILLRYLTISPAAGSTLRLSLKLVTVWTRMRPFALLVSLPV